MLKNDLTRRQVLKVAGVGAFTTQLFSGRLRGANDRIAVGFIGTGGRGGDGARRGFPAMSRNQTISLRTTQAGQRYDLSWIDGIGETGTMSNSEQTSHTSSAIMQCAVPGEQYLSPAFCLRDERS